jgi:hypothetical protein
MNRSNTGIVGSNPAEGMDARGCIQKFPDWVDNEITTINTRWEAIRTVMAAKLVRLTHKIAIQLHLVVENCTIFSSRSRRPVRKLLDTPSYVRVFLCCAVPCSGGLVIGRSLIQEALPKCLKVLIASDLILYLNRPEGLIREIKNKWFYSDLWLF